MGCHALLQGIFPTQGSEPSLSCLLLWQVGFLPLVASGKTKKWKGQTANKGSRGTEQGKQTNIKSHHFALQIQSQRGFLMSHKWWQNRLAGKEKKILLQSLLTNQIQRKLRGLFLSGMLQASIPIQTPWWLSLRLFLLCGLFCFSKPGVRRPGF